MAAQALYRRWRSRTFSEIIGQEHVTQTLLNALRAGRISHAYLFAGPRGTGKTTTARVLAKAVNCIEPQNGEPCNRCAICRSLNEGKSLDLIEIDAASNRGIDEIRALRERIAFAPNECRFKVYVVDEVHMLTNEAFNALLKTLEEPPPHAIFVLATTEPHRIPMTVLSRCQRFDFRRVSLTDLKAKLERICAQEGIRIEAAALDAIARHAAGSFRDAESLLDQLVSYGKEEITAEDVRLVLGSAPEEVIVGIVQALIGGDIGSGLRWINQALDSGVEARQLTRELLDYLRGLLLIKNGGGSLLSATAEALQQMKEQALAFPLVRLLQTARLFNGAASLLKTGIHSQLPLELAFVEAALLEGGSAAPESAKNTLERSAAPRTTPKAERPQGSDSPTTESTAVQPMPQKTLEGPQATVEETAGMAQHREFSETTAGVKAEQPTTADEASVQWWKQNWGRFLQAVRRRSRPVEALLKSCEPIAAQDDLVTLGFYHAFHRERIGEERSRAVVEEALTEVAGRPYRVKCVLYEGNRQEREQQTAADRRQELLQNPVVREAIEHFGAKVVDVQ